MMKPMFYLLLVLTIVLAATAVDYTTVHDFDGDSLSDGSYYLMPRARDAKGGGLTLAPRGGNKCPLYIGQEDTNDKYGIPVRFTDWSTSKYVFVEESDNLNIEMYTNDTICSQPTYWRVTAPDVVLKASFIKAGPKPSKGLFQMKKGDLYGSYRIYFCPGGNDCTQVGIFVDRQGVRRLALNSTTFEFWIMKAFEPEPGSDPEPSSKTIYIT